MIRVTYVNITEIQMKGRNINNFVTFPLIYIIITIIIIIIIIISIKILPDMERRHCLVHHSSSFTDRTPK